MTVGLDGVEQPSVENGRIRHALRAIRFSAWSGALLGMMAYLVGTAFHDVVPLPFGVVMAFVFGAIVGLGCSPVVIFLAWKRDLAMVRVTLLWAMAVIVPGFMYGASDERVVGLMLAWPVIVVVVAVVVWSLLPRRWNVPGRCRFCGYDIRASVDFGRCPECGGAITERAGATNHVEAGVQKEVRSRWRRLAGWLVRHPSVPVVAVVLVLLMSRGFVDERRYVRSARIMQHFSDARNAGTSVDLATAAPFAWDAAYVFEPYTSTEEMERVLGFSFPDARDTGIQLRDDGTLLVFERGGAVVEYVMIPLEWRFAKSAVNRRIARDEAVFELQANDNGGAALTPVGEGDGAKPNDP